MAIHPGPATCLVSTRAFGAGAVLAAVVVLALAVVPPPVSANGQYPASSLTSQQVSTARPLPRGHVATGRRRLPVTGPARPRPTATPTAPTVPVPSAPGPTPTPAPSSTPPAVLVGGFARRSGLPWASGVYVPGQNPSRVEAFGAWRGRPVDLVVDWPARRTWADIVSPTWLYQAWAGTPYTKVLGVPPIPEGDGSTLAGCAAGDYDQHWTQFAANLVAAGLDGQTIVRLGWEFNGDWYKWQADDPAVFAACWRRIYTAAESVAPALRWDWNVNRGPGQSLTDARRAYPGDAYVDYVGIDSYDAWPGANTAGGWQAQYAGPYGLKFWADFATAHGKQLSVPEWGVYPGTADTGHSGGDDPAYIAHMEAFFRGLGRRLAYEAYFNDDESYYAGSLFAPAQNPLAAAQYQRGLRSP